MNVDADLSMHLSRSLGISTAEADRAIRDVVAYYREPVEDFVRRRHAEMQNRGYKNPQILSRIGAELADRVVAPPALSQRQLRRMVYG